MTANDNKSYHSYSKLINEYNNTYHQSIDINSIDVDYPDSTDEVELSCKALKFKIGDRVRVTKYKKIFSRDYTHHWSKEIFVINFVLKTDP